MAFYNIRNRNNPKNKESDLYKKLTRLFSGPIVNHDRQLPHAEKNRQLSKYNFQSANGTAFNRMKYDPFRYMHINNLSQQDRTQRYMDFEQMEHDPILAVALDTYADEMSTYSDLEKILIVDCDNEQIKAVLEELYYNVLNIEHNLFSWCRTLCKFGDMFLYLDMDPERGIKNAIGLPSDQIERLEGQDETNEFYVQYQWNAADLTFEQWQMSHFRIIGNEKFFPYGTSVLEPARRVWRQMVLLEDFMMSYRVVRGSERKVFKIQVGNIPPADVEQYIQKTLNQFKKQQVADSETGRVDLRYNPVSVEDDIIIPVRGEMQNATQVEMLGGGQHISDIDDIKHIQEKLFAAVKIPQAYLSRGEGSTEGKETLAEKDMRFARIITRLQQSITSELQKIGQIHLAALGYTGSDLIRFKCKLNNPSHIAELQTLNNWRTKFEIAGAATEGFFSRRFIAEKFLGLSPKEFERQQIEMFYDKKFDARLEAMGVQADSGQGGDFGGDLGELPSPEEAGEMQQPPGTEKDSESEDAAPEEDVLMAAPGNRTSVVPKETANSLGKAWTKPSESTKKRLEGSSSSERLMRKLRDGKTQGKSLAANRRSLNSKASVGAAGRNLSLMEQKFIEETLQDNKNMNEMINALDAKYDNKKEVLEEEQVNSKEELQLANSIKMIEEVNKMLKKDKRD